MGLATFLFYVTMTTHGYTQINVVPMPSLDVCEKVKTHMLVDIAHENDGSLFSTDTRRSVIAPQQPECKQF